VRSATSARLVARFPRAVLPLTNVYLNVRELVVTASITRVAGADFEVADGLVSGAVEMAELWRAMPELTNAWLDQPLCSNDPAAARLKHFVCSSADLRLRAEEGACDSASFGLTFSAVGAQVGEVRELPALGDLCPEPFGFGDTNCDDPL